MAERKLEDRVKSLEAEINHLKILIDRKETKDWKVLVGAFLNDPYFEKAMKNGRKYRESTRPKPRKKRKSVHDRS